jgi:hypothetical protein
MDKCLDAYNLPKLNESLIRFMMSLKTELIIKLPTKKKPGADGFTGEFTKHLKNINP